MTARLSIRRHTVAALLVLALLPLPGSAQTPITLDRNRYSLQEDVRLGREAAAEARKQLPLLDDSRVDNYVENVGERLVGGIPGQFRHAGFRYSFDVVNQREINAFALPGGPMFLNRGMIEAARSEAQMASVMAHEIAHVALRHGTAQATKGEKFQIGALAGQILGAIVGGAVGGVIAQGSQFGLGAYFLKYSREYEREADLLGAQIMARAGYDPREMASMFQIIQQQGGRSGPEWLSSHPNPGNRSEAIRREASLLRVQGNANTGQFGSIQARLKGMPAAYTAEQVARGQARRRPVGTSGRLERIEPPSTRFRSYTPTRFLRVAVPANWEQLDTGDAVTYAPSGGFFEADGQTAFTHGVQIGVATGGTGDLRRDTEQLLRSFGRANPDLRAAGSARRDRVGDRAGLTTPLTNISNVTGQREYVSLSTTQLGDGSLLYMIGVAPQSEARTYESAFERVRASLQIADR